MERNILLLHYEPCIKCRLTCFLFLNTYKMPNTIIPRPKYIAFKGGEATALVLAATSCPEPGESYGLVNEMPTIYYFRLEENVALMKGLQNFVDR